MPIALIVGPAVALLGILAVVFVMRHKSVEKHSMYSARRSQIEHKVRAARERTLAPHGREEKPAPPAAAEAMPPAPPVFEAAPPAPTFTYEPSAYEPPPAAAPPVVQAQEAPDSSPWEVGPAAPEAPAAPPPPPAPLPPPPPPPAFEYPQPEPEPTYAAAPPSTEQAWTPAPAPSEPLPPAEPVLTTTPAGAGASWSVVDDTRGSTAEAEPADKKKSRKEGPAGSWQLASGDAPGTESEEEIKRPSGTVAIAQYAVLVVGLVMVLIGVLVMVANSHST
jgi:hypothetical protein